MILVKIYLNDNMRVYNVRSHLLYQIGGNIIIEYLEWHEKNGDLSILFSWYLQSTYETCFYLYCITGFIFILTFNSIYLHISNVVSL